MTKETKSNTLAARCFLFLRACGNFTNASNMLKGSRIPQSLLKMNRSGISRLRSISVLTLRNIKTLCEKLGE